MGLISRSEPPGPELVEAIDDFHPSLKKTGWFEFLMMFHDQNLQVAKEFALSFDGQFANIGDIVF